MHTSEVLRSEHFGYFSLADAKRVDFSVFCPQYCIQDRIGVVCRRLDDGILHTAYALLACTTAFYDVLRSRGGAFFDYPQHFCILGSDERGVATSRGSVRGELAAIGAPWTNLDVWPECKWKFAAADARPMMQQVLDLQIDRLFWPEDLPTEPGNGPALPHYVWRMLATHLKQVYVYNSDDPTMQVRAAETAEQLVIRSVDCLPGMDSAVIADIKSARRQRCMPGELPYAEGFRHVPVDEFLDRHAHVFR